MKLLSGLNQHKRPLVIFSSVSIALIVTSFLIGLWLQHGTGFLSMLFDTEHHAYQLPVLILFAAMYGVVMTWFHSRLELEKERRQKAMEETQRLEKDNLALKKLLKDIEPVFENRQPEKTDIVYRLEPRFTHLIEKNGNKSFQIFANIIANGSQGLIVSRKNPNQIREKYGFQKTPMLWLSRASGSNSLDPTNLDMLFGGLNGFIEKSDRGIILLDGLEYLIVHNDFPAVLKVLHSLQDSIAESNSALLIPVNPSTFDERELALLKLNVRILDSVEEMGP